MINAGRVLIIPKGEWTNLESYEMLDLVTRGDIAYIARQASVGVDPATDTQLTYWQPFGTAAKIATTTTPGLVMPDGTTITIDATGLISADIGISDINNVTITSISNGQILQYNSTTQKWENKSLGSAASRNATSSITSGSTDLIESGAVSSLNQTLETALGNKVNTSAIANNLTTTTAGKVLDARQGKALNDSKANQSLLAPIQTTLVASKAYVIGEQFVYQGLLYTVTTAIAQGGTITINGNCALSDDVTSQIKMIKDTVGKISEKNDEKSAVANNMWVEIAKLSNLSVGTYVLTGFLVFQSTSSAGSRMARFASNYYTGKEVEIYPNPNGYTQIAISDIVTITQVQNFIIQAKQNSNATMNISGQIKAIRVG